VGLRADVDVVVNRKILPCRESIPGRPAYSLLVSILTELPLGKCLRFESGPGRKGSVGTPATVHTDDS
jgi:hypothetical protein